MLAYEGEDDDRNENTTNDVVHRDAAEEATGTLMVVPLFSGFSSTLERGVM